MDETPPPAEQTPKVPPPGAELPLWADSSMAEDEKRNWSALEVVNHQNDVRWAKVYGWVVVSATVAVTATALVIFLVWTWHYIAPSKWTWIDVTRLEHLQSIIFSGGLGAIVSTIIQRQVTKNSRG